MEKPIRALIFLGLLLGGALASHASADSPALFAALEAYRERRYSEARQRFSEIAQSGPAVEVEFHLGRLALWFDDGAAALVHLERAVRLAPDDARIHNALGDAFGLAVQNAPVLAKLGWARKCLAAYQRAVELAPGSAAFRWSLLGYYCVAPRIAGGGLEKAHRQADEIARLDPGSGRVARATLALAEERFEAAFAQFEDVLRKSPDDFLALYQIGRCAALSGLHLERGRAALQRCLELRPPEGDGQPTHAAVHYRLGNLHEKRGERDVAEVHYARARELHPDFRADKIALKN